MLGIIGIILTAYSMYASAFSRDEKYFTLLAFLILIHLAVIVIAIILLIYLREIVNISINQASYIERISSEKNGLSNDIIKVNQHMEKTAEMFGTLHSDERRFSDSVSKCIYDMLAYLEFSDMPKIYSEYSAMLHHICDAAVEVKKSRPGSPTAKYSANIKKISEFNGEIIYQIIARSTGDSTRADADERENNQKLPLKKNMKYDQLIKTNIQYQHIESLRDYLEKVELENILRKSNPDRYDCPSIKDLDSHKSCIIYPIKGSTHFSDIDTSKFDFLPVKNHTGSDVIGFICLDCDEEYSFDEYDCRIIAQLADQAFGAIRSYIMILVMNKLAEIQMNKSKDD